MNIGRYTTIILCLTLLIIPSCRQAYDSSNLRYGAVSSASPEASKAGMDILEKGGNAIDAAIAVSFVLGVTEPAMSGLGGGTQVLLKIPGQIPVSINGSTISPSLTPIIWPKDILTGHKRSTIPSTVKVMGYLYNNYGSGSITWEQLLAPSISFAKEGFQFGEFRSKVYERNVEKLNKGLPETESYLLDDTYQNSSNTDLLTSLNLIASQGPDSFYKGEIASAIEADMIANDGWIRKQDLVDFPNPEEIPSVHFTYKGYDIYSQPEPCGGWIVKEMLQELERLELSDPDEDFSIHLANAIHYGHEQRKLMAQATILGASQGETTHFSVMDKDGITLSITASINAFYGAGVANPQYGFLYNSYMDDFNFENPDNKYAVGPHKMAYSSMSPTIVMKDDKVELVIGSPGSARIISTVAQLVAYYCNQMFEPSLLNKLPRIHAYDNQIIVENDSLLNYYSTHMESSYSVKLATSNIIINGMNPYFGGVHAIVKTDQGYQALADVRRDGLGISK